MLIAEKVPTSQVQSLVESPDTASAWPGSLAAGFRLTIPPTTGPVPQGLSLDARATGGELRDLQLLRQPQGGSPHAGSRRELHDGAVVEGREAHSGSGGIVRLLQKSLADADTQVRYEAAFFLNLLNDCAVGPRVAEVFTEIAPKSLGAKQPVTELWAVGPFVDNRKGFNASHVPEEGPINLAAIYADAGGTLAWKRVAGQQNYFDFDVLLAGNRDSSDYAYFRLETAKPQPIVLWIGSQQQVRVYQNGRVVWENSAGRAYKADEDRVLLNLQPGSNDFLIRVHTSARACWASTSKRPRRCGRCSPTRWTRSGSPNASRKPKTRPTRRRCRPSSRRWIGRRNSDRATSTTAASSSNSLGCSKCHAATNDATGGGGGPSLADAGNALRSPTSSNRSCSRTRSSPRCSAPPSSA